MSWVIISETRVKRTRKEHQCEYCHRTIPKGSPNIYHWVGKMDGELQSSYACHWCDEHSDIFVDGFDSEIQELGASLEAYFEDELPGVFHFNKSDGDYFVFDDWNEEQEDIRFYCPIIQEVKE